MGFAQFVQPQAPVFLFPNIERGFADAMPAADIGHTGSALGLPQRPHDLLLGMFFLRHLLSSYDVSQDHANAAYSTYQRSGFRVLGHSKAE